MKILVFLQGTILMHKNAEGKTRDEIVQQVQEGEDSVSSYRLYIPIGKAVEKLWQWKKQGAEICYLSALTDSGKARTEEIVPKEDIEADEAALRKWGFPEGKIYHRGQDESYADAVERIRPLPDALIEDDCESIGQEEITWPALKVETRKQVKSIIVKEFEGVEHVPDNIALL
jgi:hypothetical protein